VSILDEKTVAEFEGDGTADEETVREQTFVWSVALYGSEAWTLGEVEQKRLGALGSMCWRRMLKIKWTNKT
jgi:hypothetical protein